MGGLFGGGGANSRRWERGSGGGGGDDGSRWEEVQGERGCVTTAAGRRGLGWKHDCYCHLDQLEITSASVIAAAGAMPGD